MVEAFMGLLCSCCSLPFDNLANLYCFSYFHSKCLLFIWKKCFHPSKNRFWGGKNKNQFKISSSKFFINLMGYSNQGKYWFYMFFCIAVQNDSKEI
ncbi:hypothetical protein X798_02676 [Onchocerca flexuosa]|uniref:Uncharacterized protein n=1 Tax=Onchocerca flexuosa TaxID=387005 RepID=A0A238BYU5_9BILA|nr:hypothetical protein X798_02676 [Onchocerca flexuosa]